MTLISNIQRSVEVKAPGIIERVSMQEPIIIRTSTINQINFRCQLKRRQINRGRVNGILTKRTINSLITKNNKLNAVCKHSYSQTYLTNLFKLPLCLYLIIFRQNPIIIKFDKPFIFNHKCQNQILVVESKHEVVEIFYYKLHLSSLEQISFQQHLLILQNLKKDILLFFLYNEMQYYANMHLQMIQCLTNSFLSQQKDDELTKNLLIKNIKLKFFQCVKYISTRVVTNLKKINWKRIIGVIAIVVSFKFILGISYIVAVCEGLPKESQTIAIRAVEQLALKHELNKRDTAADILLYTGKKLYQVFEKVLFENNLDTEANRLRLQRQGLIEGRVKLLRLYEKLGKPESFQNAANTTDLLATIYPRVCIDIHKRGLHSVGINDAAEVYNSVKQFALAEARRNSSFYNPSTTLSLNPAIPPITPPSNIPPVSTNGVSIDCLSAAIDILTNSTIITGGTAIGGAIFIAVVALVKYFKD